MKFRPVGLLVGILCLSLAPCAAGLARDRDRYDAATQAEKAANVFREIMGSPDRGIPLSILDKAQCVAVFPNVIKGGFIVGGRYGRGVASCRTKVGWSAPAFFNLGGGSFGLQIGAQATDFIFLFMGDKGMNTLLKSKFELGGDASAAAGPVGRQVGASTDAFLGTQILTYSRSKGLFAGLELKGVVINQDGDDMRSVYGEGGKAKYVLKGGRPTPFIVRVYPNTIARYSRRRQS